MMLKLAFEKRESILQGNVSCSKKRFSQAETHSLPFIDFINYVNGIFLDSGKCLASNFLKDMPCWCEKLMILNNEVKEG